MRPVSRTNSVPPLIQLLIVLSLSPLLSAISEHVSLVLLDLCGNQNPTGPVTSFL